MPLPAAQISIVMLGVADVAASMRFYGALGFRPKGRPAGDDIAFLDAGGVVLGLYIWDKLADSVGLPAEPRPIAFRGVAIAWNCASTEDVDDLIKAAVAAGARLLGPALKTPWGAYSGYFADADGHAWEAAYTPGSGFAAAGRVIAPE
jgi:predicted lactoylglutathione lyase